MHRVSLVLLLVGILALATFRARSISASPVQPIRQIIPADPRERIKPGEILVRFAQDGRSASLEQAASLGARFLEQLPGLPVERWSVPTGDELAAAQRLARLPGVLYAEPNYILYAVDIDVIPNDPSFTLQWAHTLMNAAAAWESTTGSADVTIAIIDTGVDTSHPEFAGRQVPGYDFHSGDIDPQDGNGHGTHVAGIAAATGNNAAGVAGVDWNARIMPLRVLGNAGSGYLSNVLLAISWACTQGADILNLSLGGPDYSQSMQDAVTAAHNNGCLVVAAAGNEGNLIPFYPAAHENVLAVAAIDRQNQRTSYSNWGNYIDLSAPGGNMVSLHDPDGIYSTLPTGDFYLRNYGFYRNYDYLDGTSMAAPYISGAAALLWALLPSPTPGLVQESLEKTAVDLGLLGKDAYYGWGKVDIAAAIASLAPPAPLFEPVDNADGDGSYHLEWDDSPDTITGYTLQEDETPGFTSPAESVHLSSYADRIAVPSGIWYYRVRADGIYGSSPWSNLQSVTVLLPAPALQPIINPSNSSTYGILWGALPGATSYILQEDDHPGFSSPVVRYAGTATAYVVDGQPAGSWHYRLQAVNSLGPSPFSSSTVTSVDPAPLEAPILDSIASGLPSIINWSEVIGADGYILQESRSGYFEDAVVVYSGELLTAEIIWRAHGFYSYRVRAYGAAGQSAWSSPQAAWAPGSIYLPLIIQN